MINHETNQLATSGIRRAAIRRTAVAAICGALLAIVALFVGSVIVARTQRIPVLSRETFEAALAKWSADGAEDYVIATKVDGNQPATYRVRVVEQVVQEAFRNDYPLKDQRTLGTWSVPGMFQTIERDLQHTEHTNGNRQAPGELHLRAEFDADWGFPRRYLRVEWGKSTQVRWEVEQFEVQPADSSSDDLYRPGPE